MIKLTPRQSEILDFVKRYLEDSGYPPTRAEIAQHLGFKSPNAAEEHLKALARKGAIEMIPGASRGIRIPGFESEEHPFLRNRTLKNPAASAQSFSTRGPTICYV